MFCCLLFCYLCSIVCVLSFAFYRLCSIVCVPFYAWLFVFRILSRCLHHCFVEFLFERDVVQHHGQRVEHGQFAGKLVVEFHRHQHGRDPRRELDVQHHAMFLDVGVCGKCSGLDDKCLTQCNILISFDFSLLSRSCFRWPRVSAVFSLVWPRLLL